MGRVVKFKSFVFAAGLALGLIGVSPRASAETISLGFDVIQSTTSRAAREAEAQFRVQITDTGVGPNQALFTFTNVGSIAASITDIYFQDGTLLDIARIINQPLNRHGAVTYFSEGAKPSNLPGGKSINPSFSPTVGVNFFSLDTILPLNLLGINPGERLGVLFDLQSNRNFQSVMRALITPPPSTNLNPSLRIGIHVQGIGGSRGPSASYINERPNGIPQPTPSSPVAAPLPGPVWVGLLLMGGIGIQRLRQRRLALA
jgi:hypothetical protein